MEGVTGLAPPGFRLPDATRVGRVRLQVSDIRRSVAYYEKVLGLEVRDESTGFVALAPRGSGDVILELNERAGANPVPRRGLLGLYHFAVLLPDRASLGRFISHLSEIGVYAGLEQSVSSGGNTRTATLSIRATELLAPMPTMPALSPYINPSGSVRGANVWVKTSLLSTTRVAVVPLSASSTR